MAKAKRDRKRGQRKPLTRKQIARSKRVERQQRRIWLGVAGVAALIIVFLTTGVVREYILAPRQPVAVVNGEEISRAEYQKRVRYSRWNLQRYEQNLLIQQASLDPEDESQQFLHQYISSQLQQVQQELFSVPTQVLEGLIDETLVRQEAERRGLTVADAELQLAIEQQFGYDRNPLEPTPTPTPTTPITTTETLTPTTPVAPMTKEEFDEAYSQTMEALSSVKGFSEEDFREVMKQSLLGEKLSGALAVQVPTTDEHVHAYHILVEDEETAIAVLEKLKTGENFAGLVAEYSQDEDTVENGGELGWLAEGQRGVLATLVNAAFDLQPGEFSEAVETYLGYHIVMIDERRADYPLDEGTLPLRQAQAFDDWLYEAQQSPNIERFWSPQDVPADDE